MVTIRPLAGEGDALVELEALEFIARLIAHIPDVQERQVVYYGAYANASGIRQQHRRARQEGGESALWPPPDEEPTPFERRCPRCRRMSELMVTGPESDLFIPLSRLQICVPWSWCFRRAVLGY